MRLSSHFFLKVRFLFSRRWLDSIYTAYGIAEPNTALGNMAEGKCFSGSCNWWRNLISFAGNPLSLKTWGHGGHMIQGLETCVTLGFSALRLVEAEPDKIQAAALPAKFPVQSGTYFASGTQCHSNFLALNTWLSIHYFLENVIYWDASHLLCWGFDRTWLYEITELLDHLTHCFLPSCMTDTWKTQNIEIQ